MTKTKQKYLVLKVVRVDEKNELYKNIYRVTDETEKLNLLGFYDEKETEPVVILTNKTVLEYDWNGIAARVQKLNKEFCDQFVDKEKIIIITDEAKTEEVGQNFYIKDNIMFITEHRYNTQFKDENIVVERPKVETVEEQPGLIARIKKVLFPKRYKPKAPEEQYKTFVGELTEEEKFSAKHVWLGILFMIVLSAGFVWLDMYYSEKYKPTPVTQEFMDKITQTTTKVVFDSVKVDTIEIPDTIAFNHDFQLNQEQQRILDSLAKERRYQDSVTLYLKLHRKVKVSLHSAINDGHTERTAKTELVADSLREQDIKQLTTVINQMTKEMNNERLEELKQNRFISPDKESNFVIGMNKKDD